MFLWDNSSESRVLNVSDLFLVSDLSVLCRSDFDNSGVTGARNAINVFEVSLWDDQLIIVEVHLDILVGSGLDNVLNLESLDALVLWNGSSAVGADDNSAVASVSLISSIISSLLWHL